MRNVLFVLALVAGAAYGAGHSALRGDDDVETVITASRDLLAEIDEMKAATTAAYEAAVAHEKRILLAWDQLAALARLQLMAHDMKALAAELAPHNNWTLVAETANPPPANQTCALPARLTIEEFWQMVPREFDHCGAKVCAVMERPFLAFSMPALFGAKCERVQGGGWRLFREQRDFPR